MLPRAPAFRGAPPLLAYRWLHFIDQLGQKRIWKGRGTGPRRAGRGRQGWGVEAEVAAAKHRGCDTRHNRLRLDMEIAVHFIGAPAANQPNAIGVNAAAEHGHGAARAGRAGRNVAGGEIRERGWEEGHRPAKECGDVGGKDKLPRFRWKPIGIEGRRRGGARHAEMHEAARERMDGAERGVAAPAVTKSFPTNTILLRGKGDRHERGS